MSSKVDERTHTESVQHTKMTRIGAGALGVALLMGGATAVAQDSQQSTTPQAAPAPTVSEVYEDEILVVGSRLQRDASELGAAPITVFSEERIKELGVTNIADVLNYLPQQSFSSIEQQTVGGTRTVRLRGLGVGTSLVLINGRRTVTSAALGAGGNNSFDLNTIPLTAVQRIEVLSDSASAVYGADAVGGVLNIVLKNETPEPVADLYFGTASGGAEEKRASIGAGLNGDRFHGNVILDYFDRDYLIGSERDLYANRDFRRFGSTDQRQPFANPGNVMTTNGAPLPGLTSNVAAIPVGSTGIGLTPADFAARQGLANRNLTSLGLFSSAVPASERISAVSLAEFDVTDSVKLFTELLYAQREDSQLTTPPLITGTVVPATNPFNPFGIPVVAQYIATGLPTGESLVESDTTRAVLGASGSFFDSWDWELTALNIDESADQTNQATFSPALLAAALADTNPATSLNLFIDGPNNVAQLQGLLGPRPIINFESNALQFNGFVRGNVFELPAGAVQVVIGAEQRNEELFFNVPGQAVDADRDIMSGFTEVRIPLIGQDQGIPAVKKLSITVAGRYDDYEDFGDTFNPQYGVQWNPLDSLGFRASFGESYRAPSLSELFRPQLTAPNIIQDPRRANVVTTYALSQGGNPLLQPEESDSYTVGFVFAPQGLSIPGAFQIGVNYWSVEQDQRVLLLGPQLILANEALFPGRITRAAQTPADIAAGQPGAITAIDTTILNFGALETAGVDLELSASFETSFGKFSPTLLATFVEKYETADVPGAPVLDRVGRASLQGTVPELRAAAGLAWNLRGYGLSVTTRYIDEYDDANFQTNNLNGRTVDSQVLVDLAGLVQFDEVFNSGSYWLKGLALRLGVTNLTDEDPPFSEIGPTLGFDPSQSDVRQRFTYVSLSKQF